MYRTGRRSLPATIVSPITDPPALLCLSFRQADARPSQPRKSLDRDHRGHAGHVHGGARHHRGQRVHPAHGGQHGRHGRRGHVGGHVVPGSNAIVLPMAGWLATRFGRPPHADGLRLRLYPCVAALRPGDQPRLADLFPYSARTERRRPAATVAVGIAGNLPTEAARHGHGRLRSRHYCRTHPGADVWRLDHRQLHLALDLLYQPAGRNSLADHDQPVRRRSSLPAQDVLRRRRSMGHWLSRTRLWHVADGARYRPAQRLVRQQPDSPVDGALRRRFSRHGDSRTHRQTSHRRFARARKTAPSPPEHC